MPVAVETTQKVNLNTASETFQTAQDALTLTSRNLPDWQYSGLRPRVYHVLQPWTFVFLYGETGFMRWNHLPIQLLGLETSYKKF